MERLSKCFKFNFWIVLKSTIVFTLIYLAVYIIMILSTALQPDAQSHVNNTSFGFAASIFIFVLYSVIYSGSFNSLLLFGNTRRVIVSSVFLSGVAFSALLAVLTSLTDQLNLLLANAFGIKAYKIVDFIYSQPMNFAEEALWFFGFLLLCVAFGTFYGSLKYKFGKTFVIFFWVAFGLSFTFLPLLIGAKILTIIKDAFFFFFAYEKAGGALLAPLNFTVLAIVFAAITWLIARKQPQNA